MYKHLLKIQRLILALLIFGGGIFYTSSATARVCFLPDSTDCGEGDVVVPEVQITCATYGGYETEAACLEARTNKTAQTCTLNSGCYYPKCAYDSERNCKNDNPDKKCLSQDVDGVKCWYSQPKTCSEQGYQKTPCATDEDSGTVPNTLEASDGPCYKCTPKKECKYISNLYYGPNDTCPQYTDRKDAGVTGKDGVCSTCEPQACSAINTAYKNAANQNTCGSDKEAKKVTGTDSAADGPCYTCEDKPAGCTYQYTHLTNSITDYIRGGLDAQILRFGKDGPTCKEDGDKRTIYETCAQYNNSSSYTCGKSGPSCNASEAGKNCKVTQTCRLHYNCERGTKCWDLLSANTSIEKGGMGFPSVGTIYNKISNTSASCTNPYNVIMYETLCEGTPKSQCRKKFTPNGCESDSYSVGYAYNNTQFNVVGDKFGDCGCDTSKGLYETDDDCLKANESQSLKCTVKGDCYLTCEAAGKYSTKEACEKANPKYTECKSDASNRCYVPIKKGWGIHYTHKVEEWNNREYYCTKNKYEDGANNALFTSWEVSVRNRDNNNAVKDLDGNTHWNINGYNGHGGEERYPAGEYRICFDYSYAAIAKYIYPYYIHLAKTDGDACDYRWNDFDQQWHPDKNNKEFCSDVNLNTISGRYSACMIATFEDDTEYYVEGYFNSVPGYSCKQQEQAPY